jgi:hypothetical protein
MKRKRNLQQNKYKKIKYIIWRNEYKTRKTDRTNKHAERKRNNNKIKEERNKRRITTIIMDIFQNLSYYSICFSL